MSEQLVPSEEAVEQILSVLRTRMQDALKGGRKVHCNAVAGLKRQVWQPGVAVAPEEDGSFQFTLFIEPRTR